MKRTIATIATAVTLVLGGSAATAPIATATPAPQAQVACKSATIGGQRKCIAAGQFCARHHERDYRRYGYSCSRRDRRGNWHLTYA